METEPKESELKILSGINDQGIMLVRLNNDRALRCLISYYQMIDEILNDDERITFDGCINRLLSMAVDKEIKAIIKRHGFYGVDEFLDAMEQTDNENNAKGGNRYKVVRSYEKGRLISVKNSILEHVPADEKNAGPLLPFV